MLNFEPLFGPQYQSGGNSFIYLELHCIMKGYLQSNLTYCSIVVLQRKTFKDFFLYISMLNFEPLLLRQYKIEVKTFII